MTLNFCIELPSLPQAVVAYYGPSLICLLLNFSEQFTCFECLTQRFNKALEDSETPAVLPFIVIIVLIATGGISCPSKQNLRARFIRKPINLTVRALSFTSRCK